MLLQAYNAPMCVSIYKDCSALSLSVKFRSSDAQGSNFAAVSLLGSEQLHCCMGDAFCTVYLR